MATVTLTASVITASFPTIKLTPISTASSPPTYATLRAAQTQLNANAASIPSHGGDGLHGHVCLALSIADYAILSAIPFIPPVNPPPIGEHPAGLTAHQISELNRIHTSACSIFRTYNEVDKALRTQVIAAVADHYIEDLYDPTLGYGHVSCLTILTHLWANHGKITQDELDANQLRMHAPWNPPTPIEALFTQLNTGIRFATAGHDAPSDASVIRIGYNIIHATGLFEVACREWRGKDDATKTLLLFRRHFRDADQDRRHSTATAGSAGYHGANATAAIQPAKPAHAPSANAAVAPPAPNNAPNTTSRGPDLRPNTSYCWSHGFLKNPKHNSLTCKYKKENHQDTATATNQLGGATGNFTPRSGTPPSV
jgi:hypothetical protein